MKKLDKLSSVVWVNYIFLVDRMKKEFNVECNVGAPMVSYRETFKQSAQVQGKFSRQSGGRGQYGDVHIEFTPNETGGGFEFENAIVGGVVPREYIPSVEQGLKDAMENGVLAGYPLIDVKANYLMVLTMMSIHLKWPSKLLHH